MPSGAGPFLDSPAMATSSANPDDLDGWVTASRALDEALSTSKDTLNRLHGEFTSSLGWGQFDASSLLSGFGTWLTYNETDAQWVTAIAGAFRSAGSDTLSDSVIAATLRAADLDGSWASVTYDEPIVLGEPPTSGFADDPVNTGTGNFVEVEIDLLANGRTRLTRIGRCSPSISASILRAWCRRSPPRARWYARSRR